MIPLATTTLALICFGQAPAAEKICTKMGCEDQLTLSLRSSKEQHPQIAIELEIDGKAVTCEPPRGEDTETMPCGENVTVTHQEIQRCKAGSCEGTGKYEQSIEIATTPKRVRVRVKEGEKVLRKKTFVPTYARVRPNGRGCPPVCRQVKLVWQYL